MKKLPLIVFVLSLLPGVVRSQDSDMPRRFVRLDEAIPTIIVDMRYFGDHNFIGSRIDGYNAPVAYLTKDAAEALAGVQEELMSLGLSLKIYDSYRPQRAVNQFIEWARDLDDTGVKAEFYPNVAKNELFREGYISPRSSHTRGSTLDLTVVPYPGPAEPAWLISEQSACTLPSAERYADNSLDMGTGYDCFDTLSWTDDTRIGAPARAHRLLLKSLMEKYGFRNYSREWWHFTFENEPFPDTYFDFPVE